MPAVQKPYFDLPDLASIGRQTARKTYKDGDIVHTSLSYEDEANSDDLGFWHHPIFKLVVFVIFVQGVLPDFYFCCPVALAKER